MKREKATPQQALDLVQELIDIVREEQRFREDLQLRVAHLEQRIYPAAPLTGVAIVHRPTALAVKEN